MWRALVVVIAIVGGCRGDKPARARARALAIDGDLALQVSLRVAAVAQRPAISSAFDKLMDGIAADPQIVLAGTGLFMTISEDPKIAAPVEAIFNELAERPEMQATVMRLMEQHPDATPEEIGALVENQFKAVADSPAFEDATSAAVQTFSNKFRGRKELDQVRIALERRLTEIDTSSERAAKWDDRLIALNGGKRPDAARAKELYLANAWSDARIEQFATALATNPVVRTQTAKTLADILALKSFRADCQTAARTLVADPVIKERLMNVLLLLSTIDPSPERMRVTLRELLTAPTMVDATAKLIERFAANPDVRADLDRWFETLRADPTVRAEFVTFLDGW